MNCSHVGSSISFLLDIFFSATERVFLLHLVITCRYGLTTSSSRLPSCWLIAVDIASSPTSLSLNCLPEIGFLDRAVQDGPSNWIGVIHETAMKDSTKPRTH